MKTYESYKFIPAESENYSDVYVRYVAYPDPKREGLYAMSIFNGKEYNLKSSFLYGKCNQKEIQARILEMTEVA